MMKIKTIREELFNKQDLKYKDFTYKLNPTLNLDNIIGVRTNDLKTLAKQIAYDEIFLNDLPHKYFEENQLHAFIIGNIKDYDLALKEIEKFLPYIDNWATCDQLKVKCFILHKEETIKKIKKWIKSKHTYTVRYAIGLLMSNYLGPDFDIEYLKLVRNIKSDEYYINMMRAWYFQTALSKNYTETYNYLKENHLDEWTLNKTIQKCKDSYRIDDEKIKKIIDLKN